MWVISSLEKNEITIKQHLYVIKETQQMPAHRNLRRHKEDKLIYDEKNKKEYIQSDQEDKRLGRRWIITNSMTVSKWSGLKEEHIKSKTKRYQPRRTDANVKRTFQESAWKIP